MRRLARNRLSNSSGQALVEYALLTLIVIGIFSTIQFFTIRGIGKIWLTLAKEIASGCPRCTPSEEFQKR